MKVMVIDDDPTALSVLQGTLEKEGHEVIVRAESLGTVNAVARERPNVAVVDVRMPGLAGDRLASLLVKDNPQLLVVLHSCLPPKELEKMARQTGAHAYIEKKGDPAAFVAEFARITADRRVASVAPRRR